MDRAWKRECVRTRKQISIMGREKRANEEGTRVAGASAAPCRTSPVLISLPIAHGCLKRKGGKREEGKKNGKRIGYDLVEPCFTVPTMFD